MVELQPYSVGILEQQRIVSGRPLILARRANDGHAERAEEAVQFIDVGALAGAKAEMVQARAARGPPLARGRLRKPGGKGRVVEHGDAPTSRLAHARGLVLLGIEPVVHEKPSGTPPLSAPVAVRYVTLAWAHGCARVVA